MLTMQNIKEIHNDLSRENTNYWVFFSYSNEIFCTTCIQLICHANYIGCLLKGVLMSAGCIKAQEFYTIHNTWKTIKN